MSAREIADRIPQEYRREILELNMIDRAVAQVSDETMFYLGVIWKNYIEPEFSPDCNLCYTRVLDNFRQMKSILVELENEYQLLKQA